MYQSKWNSYRKLIFDRIFSLFDNPLFITTSSIVSGLTLVNSFDTIPPNHIGYSNLFGNIKEKKLNSGLHLKNPFSKFIKISLLTSNLPITINVTTKEGLTLLLETNTIYTIDESSSREIYMKYRNDYDSILIKPLIESSLRNIISSYEVKDLYCEKTRTEIKNKMNIELTNVLGANGFIVSNTLINNIRLPEQLQKSIENKLKSEQENEQMAFIIEKEKKQLIFNIEKEKMEAERKTIEANGIKSFQDIVSKGISKELITWKAIEATEKLSKSNNSKIIIIGNKDSGGLPIIIPTDK
jgi:regulator of protease activity HflC (stomatin/prohibitin superfamily)